MKTGQRTSKQVLARWLELAGLVFLFTGILILVNIIAFRHSWRFDVTPGKKFTLSPQTLQILSSLTDDLDVTIFYKKGEEGTYQDLLKMLSRASDKFHYHVIDLDKNPAKAQSYGIRDYGAGVVEYQGRRESLRVPSEESLINAILRIKDNKMKTVRFTTGHGEKSISSGDKKISYSNVKNALELENYKVEELLLLQTGSVPEDTAVLVIGGPQKDFSAQETTAVDRYLKKGGRALFLCDPCPLPQLEGFLKTLDIELPRDFVVDRESKLYELDELTPLIFPDKTSPITSRMKEAALFPLCRSVIPAGQQQNYLLLTIIARSGPRSWAERNTQSVYSGSAGFDRETDVPGPVPVAAAVEVLQPAGQQQASRVSFRFAVMGDSDFITNQYLDVLGNKDLFLNTVNWLAERSDLVTIRPKTAQSSVSMLFLTEGENQLILWTAVIIEPALVLLAGIAVVFWRRRFRR
jgi:ABC-type uncharacterized transport system involved in gliding motility auxiliary subunit